ncbi:class I SAM-dependent methyltransferase [Phytoactinopolyspora halotolerans]|uniref:Class I SAM-dependent methyltransferase n=1 Tax=Phytoactinopolyspora halotolerans TaxID=1981512 RepID=A0A6L9SFH0_9ACTN|nr:class I SAM-dependent methyltransferase [Phytoactinopolyspora halotolerans]NEE02800.1 class I SAM-dependent methyltransferase [Phytoactinopolyspora halotolerans]
MTTDEPPVVIDWAEHAERLSAAVDDDAAWYAEMAQTLVKPDDRLAVDVGCGGAGMALALSAVLPRDASVVGLDGDDDVLQGAQRRVADAQIDGARIWLIKADLDTDLGSLPALAQNADLMWASASIHHAADQQAAIDALAGFLAPGGRLALAEGGLRVRHLPWDLGVGTPGLEDRLVAAEGHWFGRMRESLPGSVRMPYGWTTALRRAGLGDVTTRTTLLERPAPLQGADLNRVLDGLAHRVERITESGDLDPDDGAAWARLLDPGDDAWLGRRDDVHSLSARSVHIGRRPA